MLQCKKDDFVKDIRDNKVYQVYRMDLNDDGSINHLDVLILDKNFKSLHVYISYMESDYKNLIEHLKLFNLNKKW